MTKHTHKWVFAEFKEKVIATLYEGDTPARVTWVCSCGVHRYQESKEVEL